MNNESTNQNEDIQPNSNNEPQRSPQVVKASEKKQSDNKGVEESAEEKEIAEVKSKFQNAPKFKKWRELYYDRSNEATFGKATECAIIAYGLDSRSQADRIYASNLGYRNTKKCENWAREFLSSTGITPEYQLATLADKATKTNNAKYLQMLMEVTGIYTPGAATLVQNNTQNNTQINIDGKEVEDFNKKFKEFIESQ